MNRSTRMACISVYPSRSSATVLSSFPPCYPALPPARLEVPLLYFSPFNSLPLSQALSLNSCALLPIDPDFSNLDPIEPPSLEENSPPTAGAQEVKRVRIRGGGDRSRLRRMEMTRQQLRLNDAMTSPAVVRKGHRQLTLLCSTSNGAIRLELRSDATAVGRKRLSSLLDGLADLLHDACQQRDRCKSLETNDDEVEIK